MQYVTTSPRNVQGMKRDFVDSLNDPWRRRTLGSAMRASVNSLTNGRLTTGGPAFTEFWKVMFPAYLELATGEPQLDNIYMAITDKSTVDYPMAVTLPITVANDVQGYLHLLPSINSYNTPEGSSYVSANSGDLVGIADDHEASWAYVLAPALRPRYFSKYEALPEGESPVSLVPEGIEVIFTERGNDYGVGTIRLTEDTLAELPEGQRGYATRNFDISMSENGSRVEVYDTETDEITRLDVTLDGEDVAIRNANEAWQSLGRQTVADIKAESRRKFVDDLRSRRTTTRAAEKAAEAREKLARAEASAERFKKFSKAQAKQAKESSRLVIPELPFVPHGLASSRRWGIEIESAGARGVVAPAGWARKRDGSLRSAYDGYTEVQTFEPYDEEVTSLRTWSDCENAERHNPYTMVHDEARDEWVPGLRQDYLPVSECSSCGLHTATVRREPQTIRHTRRDDDCAEFVSPILTSMHSNGLEEVLNGVKVQPQNDTAGVHVHVESSDLSKAQIATVVYAYGMIEPWLLSSYQRETREYCKQRSASDVLDYARSAKSGGGSHRAGDRYLSVNLNALTAHGTIEFRSMGPVYDYEYLVRWAMFCREIVNMVKAGATVAEFGHAASTWEGMLELMLKYGKEYARAVVYEATGETGEWAKLVKSESTDIDAITTALSVDTAEWLSKVATNRTRRSLNYNHDAQGAVTQLLNRLTGVSFATAI